MRKGGPVGSPGLQNTGGLGCSVLGKPKGLKDEATWQDFRSLWEFGFGYLGGYTQTNKKGRSVPKC
jgi:hypothetical protein